MVTLRYDDEHAMLRDETRRWLAAHCDMATVRRLGDDFRGDDSVIWKALSELGWLGLATPERYGGTGLGFTHLAVVLEESGRHLLPSPLLPVLLAAMVIEHGGSEAQRSRWLPQLVRGDVIATLAHVEASGAWRPQDTSVTRAHGRLSGAKSFVWAAPAAHLLLMPFRDAITGSPTRIGLVDAAASGVQIVPEIGLDQTRRSGRVILRDVTLEDDAILPMPADAIFAHLLPRACTALAAEMAGGADALLSMTAAYAATRVQFGKPIGAFQAVKHPLVNILIGVEQLRSLVYAAASAIDASDTAAELLARMAKAAASDVYSFAGSRAIQLHGGFGFTIDCDAHFYLKRALASRPAFGDARHHRRWIGDRLAEGG